MNIGLYGGSFDPIHQGHIEPVLEARRAAELDRVIYLPTARPPHKQDRRLISPQARFTMVEMALLDHPELEVSDFEMDTSAPSYTVETLEHFHRPDRRLHLIVGADSFIQLDRWVRWRDILTLARLVVLTRPGWTADRDTTAPELLELMDLDPGHERSAVLVENRPIAASSTEIRRRLAQGESVPAGWLPRPVLKYIEKYGFYGSRRSVPEETS